MKKFNGYEAKRSGGGRDILPAGGYVAKVQGAKEVEKDWGKFLEISFEIDEGEHKGFFATDYINNSSEIKTWRGVYRLFTPKDDGSEKDRWTKNTFGNAMWAFEESNEGFRWNWKESELAGKLIGVLFRNKEWEINGRTGWSTECCALIDVDSIRTGKYKMPKDKPLSNTAQATVTAAPAADDDEEDCPF